MRYSLSMILTLATNRMVTDIKIIMVNDTVSIRVSLVFLQRAYKEFLILRTDREISYDDSNFSR